MKMAFALKPYIEVITIKTVLSFIKREIVLCVACFLAIVSSFIVTPDAGYKTYIDFRTLAILFSLMCVMAGLQSLGIFKKVAEGMLKSVKGERGIVTVLVLLCFFFSMFITNDVALITFVPLTFTTLELAGKDVFKKNALLTVVLQTIAANLGSMLTPIGNPQNLYLYGKSGMGIGSFIMIMLPYTIASLVLIFISIYAWTSYVNKKNVDVLESTSGSEAEVKSESESELESKAEPSSPLTLTEMFAKTQTKYHSLLIMYVLLFIVAVCVVIRVLPYQVMLLLTLVLVVLSDRKTLKRVDYSLLLTFIGFFIFIGNMGRIPAFAFLLRAIVAGKETITAVVSSQVISNVPAALLLSGFTDNYKALIIGTNLGGLGTLIASMASLISYKMVAAHADIETGKYFKAFTLMNVLFLAVLLILYLVIA